MSCILFLPLFPSFQVIKLLSDNASSTPQSLGDPRKESSEELQARHARVLAATCAALASIIVLQSKSGTSSDTTSSNDKAIDARKALLTGAQSLLENSTFLRSTLQSKEASVRRSAYGLISSVCSTAPDLVSSADILSHVSPIVFGAIGDKESGNHPSMWGMVLSLASTHPKSWNNINLNKAVLPKLWSFLRHGCYGSAEGSYPAVLPFIALLPQGALGIDGYQSVLNAVWDGMYTLSTQGQAQQAAAGCFRECYVYAMIKAETVAGPEGASVFCTELTQSALEIKCLTAALSADGELSRRIVGEIVGKLAEYVAGEESSRHWKLQLVIDSIGRVASQSACLALESTPGAPGVPHLPLIGSLLLLVKDAVVAEKAAVDSARPVVAALLSEVRSGSATPEATALLASLVKAMPALNTMSSSGFGGGDEITSNEGQLTYGMADVRLQQSASFTADSIVKRVIEEKQTGAALEASCDLIVSCLPQLPHPATALADALSQLNKALGAKAAYSLLIHFVITAHSDNELIAARSAALDDLCIGITSSFEKLATEHGLVGLVHQLMTGNGMVSLLSESGQVQVLTNLTHGVQTAENDEFVAATLRVIERCVRSPALSNSHDGVIGARLKALGAVFEVLVEEACASAAVGGPGSDDDDDDESSEEESNHSELYG